MHKAPLFTKMQCSEHIYRDLSIMSGSKANLYTLIEHSAEYYFCKSIYTQQSNFKSKDRVYHEHSSYKLGNNTCYNELFTMHSYIALCLKF